jgi:hypothetical protein
VLVLHRFLRLAANTQRDVFYHAENLSKSLLAGKRKGQTAEVWPINQECIGIGTFL